ncbi:hypothetical protein VOLCADRAFT_87558 [Volvox carteri f. nagariensis]|uniref:Small acidic protein-like domain-containing protein n=1 Tax=Volvox carteri f. nagariensis TaxID=3068 RepID=D8TLL9_VOLCA|nr:uncharacterized protein VOLCADRAFT_87558 [Volvox carteri f. nagariensis]EFJ51897.1 hypothetical protein VOLCADRAFT_87558 [Volvox carteri f. nagariensis]|eukprot:XP_002947307.1 hypothetical protein VOLCADRAFT_87558 [Volvox carteri f. nagariensis]
MAQLKTNNSDETPQPVKSNSVPDQEEAGGRTGGRQMHGSRGHDREPQADNHEGVNSYNQGQRNASGWRPEQEDDRRREDRHLHDRQRLERDPKREERGGSLQEVDRDRDRERDRDRDRRDWDVDRGRDSGVREWERERDRPRGDTERGAAYDLERDRPPVRAREREMEQTQTTPARHSLSEPTRAYHDDRAAAGDQAAGGGASASNTRPLSRPSTAASPPRPSSTPAADPGPTREEHRVMRAPYGPPNMRREDPLPHQQQRGQPGSSPLAVGGSLSEHSGPQDREREREREPGTERDRKQDVPQDVPRRDASPPPDHDSCVERARWGEERGRVREREREHEQDRGRERDRGEGRRSQPLPDDRRLHAPPSLGSGPVRELPRVTSHDGRANGEPRRNHDWQIGGVRPDDGRPGGMGRSEYDRPGSRGRPEYDRPGSGSRTELDRPPGGSSRPEYDRPNDASMRPEYDRQGAAARSDYDRPNICSNSRYEYDRPGAGGTRPEYDRAVRRENGGGSIGGGSSGLDYEQYGSESGARALLSRANSAPGQGPAREYRSRPDPPPPGPGPGPGTRGEESPRSRRAVREREGRSGADDREHEHDRHRDQRGYHRDREVRERELRERDRDLRDRELRDRELRDRELRERDLRDRGLRDRERRERELREHGIDRGPRDNDLRDRDRCRSEEWWAGAAGSGGAYGAIYGAPVPRGGSGSRETADWRRGAPTPPSLSRDAGPRGGRDVTPLAADMVRYGGSTDDAGRRSPRGRSPREDPRGPATWNAAPAGHCPDEAGQQASGPVGEWGEGTGVPAAAAAPRTRAPLFVGSVRPAGDAGRVPPPSSRQQRRTSPEPQEAQQQPLPQPPLQQQPLSSPVLLEMPLPPQQQYPPGSDSVRNTDSDEVGEGPCREEARHLTARSCDMRATSCSSDGTNSSPSKQDEESKGAGRERGVGASGRSYTDKAGADGGEGCSAGGDVGRGDDSNGSRGQDAPVDMAVDELSTDVRPLTEAAATSNAAGRSPTPAPSPLAVSASPHHTPPSSRPGRVADRDGSAAPPPSDDGPSSRREERSPMPQRDTDGAAAVVHAGCFDNAMEVDTAAARPEGREGRSGGAPLATAIEGSTGRGSAGRGGTAAGRVDTLRDSGAGPDANRHRGDEAQQRYGEEGRDGRAGQPYKSQERPASQPLASGKIDRGGSGGPRPQQPYQDSNTQRGGLGRREVYDDDRRARQLPPPPGDGRHDMGGGGDVYGERRPQLLQPYGSGGEPRRDDYDDRRRPAPSYILPPSSLDSGRRDPYDDGRLPPRRDDYDDRRPPPRRRDDPYDDWRSHGPRPTSQRRDEYDDRSRQPSGTRGPGRDSYPDRRPPPPPSAHGPSSSAAAGTASAGPVGPSRGDPYDVRPSQPPPSGRGSEGYREREWADRGGGGGGGAAVAPRGYGRDGGPGPRREGSRGDRGGWGRERDVDRERDYHLRERERGMQVPSSSTQRRPADGPPGSYRDGGGGGGADRRPGSPLPPPKRLRTSPPRGPGGGAGAQRPPPAGAPGGAAAGGVEGAALSSADIVRAMMAAPPGGPVPNRAATSAGGGGAGGAHHAAPGSMAGSGSWTVSGSGSAAAPAAAAAAMHPPQLTADQKRKLLWGTKKVETVVNQGAAESLYGANRWDRAAEVLETDRDKERFQRLMGLKGELAHRPAYPPLEARPPSPGSESHLAMTREQQERVLGDVEQQYLAGLKRKDGRTAGLGIM